MNYATRIIIHLEASKSISFTLRVKLAMMRRLHSARGTRNYEMTFSFSVQVRRKNFHKRRTLDTSERRSISSFRSVGREVCEIDRKKANVPYMQQIYSHPLVSFVDLTGKSDAGVPFFVITCEWQCLIKSYLKFSQFQSKSSFVCFHACGLNIHNISHGL